MKDQESQEVFLLFSVGGEEFFLSSRWVEEVILLEEKKRQEASNCFQGVLRYRKREIPYLNLEKLCQVPSFLRHGIVIRNPGYTPPLWALLVSKAKDCLWELPKRLETQARFSWVEGVYLLEKGKIVLSLYPPCLFQLVQNQEKGCSSHGESFDCG